jgi:hypothetical protein
MDPGQSRRELRNGGPGSDYKTNSGLHDQPHELRESAREEITGSTCRHRRSHGTDTMVEAGTISRD